MAKPRIRTSVHGNLEARSIAGDAFGQLTEVVAPAAAEWYAAAYGPDWEVDRNFASNAIGARNRSLRDEQELLTRLDGSPEFNRVFAPHIDVPPTSVYSLAGELRDLRNDLVHRNRPWEASDAWRTVDRVLLLLSVFGLADEVSRARLAELGVASAAIVAGDRAEQLTALRRDYAESVLLQTGNVDLGGVSPNVGSRVVKARLDAVYVEPRLVRPDLVEGDSESQGLAELLLIGRAIVLGGPGAGKTTLTRRIARILATGGLPGAPDATPILVIAARFAEALEAESGLTLSRFITQRLSDRFGTLYASELELGRAIVLVDGLDEVVEERLRSRVATLVGEFSNDYPNIGLVATSRPMGYRPPTSWSSFSTLEIAAMDVGQVTDFVGRWVSILDDDTDAESTDRDSTDLLADITSEDGVHALAETPLLLTILVLLWHRGTRLPQHRAELYDLATMTLLRDWPARRLGRTFDERQFLQFLQPVALDLVASGQSTVGERDLMTRWAGMFKDLEGLQDDLVATDRARAFLQLIGEHTGFFVESGFDGSERQYAFLHKTFMEYVAATALAEAWDAGTLDLSLYLHVVRWHQVIELFAGHVGRRGQASASRLADEILNAETPSERYLQRNVPLLVALMRQDLEPRPELRDRIISLAVGQVLDPGLEPFRTWRGVSLAYLARELPEGIVDRAIRALAPSTREAEARSDWLRVLVRPESDDFLGRFIESYDTLATVAFEPEADLHYAIGRPFDSGEAVDGILRLGDEWFGVDADGVERFARSGVQVLTVSDVAASTDPLLLNRRFVVDAASVENATVDDAISLLKDDRLLDVAALLKDPEWLEAHPPDVPAALETVDGLPPHLWFFAKSAYDVLNSGPSRDAWLGLTLALVLGGNEITRQVALVRYLTSEFGSFENVDDVITQAIEIDPRSAPAVPVALAMQGGAPEPALVERCEAMALNDPDPILRGLARRGLAVTTRVSDPLGILSSPDVAIPAGSVALLAGDGPTAGMDTTGDLIVRLLLLENDNADSQRACAAIARQIIEAGPFVPYDLSGGDLWTNPSFDELARDLALATRPECRAWSGQILQALDRGTASDELAVLLADAEKPVRDQAVGAIQEVDLRSPAWLESTMLRYFELEQGVESAETFAHSVARQVDASTLEYLTLLLEDFLDHHPGNHVALFFLMAARSER